MAKQITRTFTGKHYTTTCATSDRQWRTFIITINDTSKLTTEQKVKNRMQNYLNECLKEGKSVLEVITDKDGKERREYSPLKSPVAVMFIDNESEFEELKAMDTDDFYRLSTCIKINGEEVKEVETNE